MRDRSHRLRALAIFALIAWTSSTAAAIVDLTCFRHVKCAEHGETIHAGAVDSTDPSSHELFVAAPRSDLPSHGHDHCAVPTLAQERGAALSAARVRHAAPPITVAAAGAPLPAHAAVAMLRVAPKSSPPLLRAS